MRPSTRVTTLHEDSKVEVARRRRVAPAELPKRLRGDLDWITLKAIAHDPSERYGSAADLAEDIERFLADEPVSAHAPTAGYLLRKLVRRHRGRVIAAAMVAAALVLGVVGTGVGLLQARAEAERANREAARASREADAARLARDRAVESRQTSDQLAAYLVELFESTDPNQRDTSSLTARELLQRGAEALESGLSDQPRAKGALLLTIGNIFTSWSDFSGAESLLREAVIVLGSPGIEPSDSLARALRKLVYVTSKLGHHRQALEFAEHGLAVQDELGDAADTGRTAKLLVSGAAALRSLGRLDEADSWLRRGLELYRREDAPAGEIGVAFIELGGVAYMRQDWQGVIDHNQAAIELFEQEKNRNSLNRIGTSLSNLGTALIRLGRLSEAEAAFTRGWKLAEEARGPDSPRIPSVLYGLGVVWSEQGNFARSEAALRRSLELRRRVRPASDPTIAKTLDSLGWTIWRSDNGRSREVVALLTESLEIFQQASEPSYPGHMDVLFHIGQIELTQGRPARAESRYREALEFLERFEEPNASDLAAGNLGLGRSLSAQERAGEARAAFAQALRLLEAAGDVEGLAEARAEIEELGP